MNVISETDYLREKTRLMCIIAEKDKLLKIQLANNKLMNERRRKLEEECIEYQKEIQELKRNIIKKK